MLALLAGDFNSNTEPGPEQTDAIQKILTAGYADIWKLAGNGDPGYTWPLFGEDQMSGAATPNERIDLLFIGGDTPRWMGKDPKMLSIERTGMTPPWASDHAGIVVNMRIK
jgi:hypothetical protein